VVNEFDLTYVTVDSVSEGVGSSQILPLLRGISREGLSVNLISFEKRHPAPELEYQVKGFGIDWSIHEFKSFGAIAGVSRFREIMNSIPETQVIHSRSDIATAASILSKRAPTLWDVRSLWPDQRLFMETTYMKKTLLKSTRAIESFASHGSSAMSTLTSAVVPILEARHMRIPSIRTVVPTSVDLDAFQLSETFPRNIKALFSGTYNNYYDLNLSRKFIEEFRKATSLEVHWARPKESFRQYLAVGEDYSFEVTQPEMSKLIQMYSFGISICKLDAGPSLAAAMPTKVAEFLACGRPVVINSGLGDLDQFVREFDAGVVLDGTSGDEKVKVEALLKLLSDPETPNRCRALAEKYFDMRKGIQKYLRVYEQIKRL
jgi:hypothetical protein